MDDLAKAMRDKANAGMYDNLHPVTELVQRARSGDSNAESALRMRSHGDGADAKEARAACQQLGL